MLAIFYYTGEDEIICEILFARWQSFIDRFAIQQLKSKYLLLDVVGLFFGMRLNILVILGK